MCGMSKASEIANNVWLGPTPNTALCESGIDAEGIGFDILIEASDLAQAPNTQTLNKIGELSYQAPQTMDFPSSGSVVPQKWLSLDPDPLTVMCHWIYNMANPWGMPENIGDEEKDADGDSPMKSDSPSPRKILIHCTDGYTESTLLGLAYFMFAEGLPVHEAWLRMHCEKKRNFFAYHCDVTMLSSLQSRLLAASPAYEHEESEAPPEDPAWLSRIDGSLPSRILPYLYLGNIGHANNPELLKAMGIKYVLSVGEPVNWDQSQIEAWGEDRMMFIDKVQDNGVDSLTQEFDKCLDFIARGKMENTATLVHCRVGVSRSATICIAEVMSALAFSFPRA